MVPAILKTARSHNSIDGETGAPIVDDDHFAQHVEGRHDAVAQLLQNLQRDPRHTELRGLGDGPAAGRHFNKFRMGCASVDGPRAIEALVELAPSAVVTATCPRQ